MQHCSPGEDARKEFSCSFSPCPGSHVRHKRKFLLPAFCGQKTEPSHLKWCRTKKKSPCPSAALFPWRRCQAGILLLLLTLPGQPCESALKFCSLLSVVRKLTKTCTHAEPELTSAKCSTAPPEQVPGRNSLAASHPALAAM